MFVPFLATLFVNKKIDSFNESEIHLICNDFKDLFDLKISPQAMISILQKARKVDLINKGCLAEVFVGLELIKKFFADY